MLENRRTRAAWREAVEAAGIEVLAPARVEVRVRSGGATVTLADGRG